MKPGQVVSDFEELPLDTGAIAPGQVISDFEEIPQAEDSLSSGAEAAARATAEGATLGFSEEVAGGIGALPKALQGKEAYLQEYKRIKSEQEAKRKALEEQYPTLSAVSEFAGGMIPVAPGLSIASKIPKAIKTAGLGAAAGGVFGAGKSEADLTKGEVLPLTKDVAEGAAFGAVAGGLGELAYQGGKGLISKLGKGISDLDISQTAKKQYEAGKKGIATFGTKAEQEVADIQKTAASKAYEQFSNLSEDNLKRQQLSEEYSKAIETAKAGGVPDLDVLGGLGRAKLKVKEFLSGPTTPTVKSELDHAVGILDELESSIANSANPEEAVVAKKAFDSYIEQISDPYSKKALKEASKEVRSELNKIPGMSEINEKYKAFFDIQKQLGLTGSTLAEQSEYSKRIIQLIRQATGKSGESAVEAKQVIDKYKQLLEKTPPEVKESLTKSLDDAIERTGLQKEASDFGFGKFRLLRGLTERGANIAGRTVKNVKDFTPESTTPLVRSMVAAGGASARLAEQLVKLPKLDIRGRQALLFSIMQDPANRKILEEFGITEDQFK